MPPVNVVGDYVPLTGGAITGDLSTTGFVNAQGGVFGPSFKVTSAAHLKQDIEPVTASVASAIIGALRPVTYKWQSDPAKLNYGFTVDDVQRAVPTVVDEALDVKHYDIVQIVALLVSEVQSLRASINQIVANRGRI
jgi:hypothetical protein